MYKQLIVDPARLGTGEESEGPHIEASPTAASTSKFWREVRALAALIRTKLNPMPIDGICVCCQRHPVEPGDRECRVCILDRNAN
jgi:hypothetical protein